MGTLDNNFYGRNGICIFFMSGFNGPLTYLILNKPNEDPNWFVLWSGEAWCNLCIREKDKAKIEGKRIEERKIRLKEVKTKHFIPIIPFLFPFQSFPFMLSKYLIFKFDYF